MSDDASFQVRHIQAVHGDTLRCIVTDMSSNVECHHILGRGGRHNRKLMSSILNCAPIWVSIHKKGWVNNEHFQLFLLEIVKKKVDAAVAAGIYEYTKLDQEFIREFHNGTPHLL